jgi:hypothetical protein
MKIGYADPPYPKMAKKYKEKEVDYAALIQRLIRDYDAWILCQGAKDLPAILPMIPPGTKYRIAAWVKPFAFSYPGVNPMWTWEPVIFSGGRKGREMPLVKDHLICNAKGTDGKSKYFFGAKPQPFNHWILDLVGWRPEDEVTELYIGTNGFEQAIAERLKHCAAELVLTDPMSEYDPRFI